MSVTFIGTTFPDTEEYGKYERQVHDSLYTQINNKFPHDDNLLLSTTWLGPQFSSSNDNWDRIMAFKDACIKFHNVFLVATVDPPMLTDDDIRDIKESTNALSMYMLGHFDTPYHFNFFSTVLGKNFTKYSHNDTELGDIKFLYVNYNRKPKHHRVDFVNKLIKNDLLKYGNVTLGKDHEKIHNKNINIPYLTLGETHEDWVDQGNNVGHWHFDIPMDYYSLHRMDIWNSTFLYINAATEFNPRDELFCQQDVFKPLVGMRPFVVNGVQRTYHWYRHNGFNTFNHYWKHIDIENGDVHDTLVELINYIKNMRKKELMDMYQDMIPELTHNKERFYEFASEQQHKIDNLFTV
jgi:hypothetical protein